MAENMNYILVKTIVKKAIHDIKTDSERTVRNLVDMALQFTDSRFQKQFFSTARNLLSNEHSGYYSLVKDALTKTDEDTLLTFSMNLGFNGLYCSSKYIRQHEVADGFNIPWSTALTVSKEQQDRHHEIIEQGEALRIHTWYLFSNKSILNCISLAARHPQSAFICFCDSGEIDINVLDLASETKNMALLVPYDANADIACSMLREAGLLYGLHYSYGDDDIDMIERGELVHDMEQLYPAVCVFKPKKLCQAECCERVYKWISDARLEQKFRTIPWEIYADMLLVDEVISDEPCWVGFDSQGQLNTHKGKCDDPDCNIFKQDLPKILRQAFPRKQ